jgi:hypothetical protein
MTSEGKLRVPYVIAYTTIVGVIIVGSVVAIARLFDDSPAETARRFTHACLADKWEAADRFLEDDAVQRTEFDRWWTRLYPSIADAHRPNGDDVEITVAALQETATSCTFHVTIASPFIGVRSQVQCWYAHGKQWHFNAQETLMEMDKRAFASSRQAL